MLNVVIIGGVAAGTSAAAKLKRNLKDRVNVVLYEMGDTVSFGACGLPFYIRDTIKEAGKLVERTPEQFAEQGIDVRIRHEVEAVDLAGKNVAVRDLGTGETFRREYDKLIVASGASVRRICPFDVPRDNLHVVRSLHDGVRLKEALVDEAVRHVVVVGGGFIGLEIVEACVELGKKVLLIEFADRVLNAMDPEVTDVLAKELQRRHVTVDLESKAADLVCDNNRVTGVVVEGGGGNRTVETDLVVNCVGIVPNAAFIDVRKAVNGAIIVNERMETSDPDVYAAGDCSIMTSFITGEHQYAPLGTTANKQGRMIAEILSGKTMKPFKLLGSSAIRLFDMDAAKVGLSEIDAQRLNLDYRVSRVTGNSFASYYSGDRVMVKIVYDAKSRKILGAQTVGHGVVAARANYYAIAIAAGLTVDEFAYLDFNYSPPFSGVWDVTQIAANTAK